MPDIWLCFVWACSGGPLVSGHHSLFRRSVLGPLARPSPGTSARCVWQRLGSVPFVCDTEGTVDELAVHLPTWRTSMFSSGAVGTSPLCDAAHRDPNPSQYHPQLTLCNVTPRVAHARNTTPTVTFFFVFMCAVVAPMHNSHFSRPLLPHKTALHTLKVLYYSRRTIYGYGFVWWALHGLVRLAQLPSVASAGVCCCGRALGDLCRPLLPRVTSRFPSRLP